MVLLAVGFVTYLLHKKSGHAVALDGSGWSLRTKDHKAIVQKGSLKHWGRNLMPSNVFEDDGRLYVHLKESQTTIWFDQADLHTKTVCHQLGADLEGGGAVGCYTRPVHTLGQSLFWKVRYFQDTGAKGYHPRGSRHKGFWGGSQRDCLTPSLGPGAI